MMKTKQMIFDELSRVITDFENNEADQNDLYNTLTDIQDNWESVITSED